jgi:hypothetical protein
MYRKILIGGVTAAAIVGAGGTALALSGSDTTTSGNPVTAAATQNLAQVQAAGKHKHRLLRGLSHAQIVTKGKDGFVTHNLIKGSVTAVSATSITVQAADKTSEKFVINKDTKVRVRSNGKGAASSIDKVAVGDQVTVAGTGTSTITAKHVVDVKK